LGYDIRSEAPRERSDRHRESGYPSYAPAGLDRYPPAAQRDPEPSDPHEQTRMVQLRNAALMRMREMSSRHGMHAFDERRGPDAMGPHAIAFLYQDYERRPGMATQEVVRAATRLFRDSDEVRDLPQLLHTLAGIAQQYAARGPFDPRRTMVHRNDDMTTQARYIGVAVSSLDTPAGHWASVQERARNALEIAGRSYMHLIDDTRVILDRGGPFGVVGITQSTAPLEAGGLAYGNWQPLHLRPGDPDEPVWMALETLHLHVAHGVAQTAHHRQH
jgi:hypothetical protein